MQGKNHKFVKKFAFIHLEFNIKCSNKAKQYPAVVFAVRHPIGSEKIIIWR